ncbi:hypothetical protein ACFE04_007466 [Oxalis oulophora]
MTTSNHVPNLSLNYSFQHCCKHPQVIHQVCRYCNYFIADQHYGIPFNYVHPGLRLSREETARYRKICTDNVLTQRKLHLILDIDHTLLHAVNPFDFPIPTDFEFFRENSKSLRDNLLTLELNDEYHSRFLVKLRPFVRDFLKEASSLAELTLYTMGTSVYARGIARLLDPQGIYFGNRIISRDDTPTRYKTMDIVCAQERTVIIIDDTDIWPNNRKNLMLIKKYCYFDTEHMDGYLKSGTDESESEGELVKKLRLIKEAHRRFFEEGGAGIACKTLDS